MQYFMFVHRIIVCIVQDVQPIIYLSFFVIRSNIYKHWLCLFSTKPILGCHSIMRLDIYEFLVFSSTTSLYAFNKASLCFRKSIAILPLKVLVYYVIDKGLNQGSGYRLAYFTIELYLVYKI
jgi:hypothetical protein